MLWFVTFIITYYHYNQHWIYVIKAAVCIGTLWNCLPKLDFNFIFLNFELEMSLDWVSTCNEVQNHCSQFTLGKSQFSGASWCWRSSIKVAMPHLVGHSAPAWLVLHILWSRNRAGPSAPPHISGPNQDLQPDESTLWNQASRGFDSTKAASPPQLPVLSTGMSSVGSLCWVAEDLRSESPMVRLLSLVRGGLKINPVELWRFEDYKGQKQKQRPSGGHKVLRYVVSHSTYWPIVSLPGGSLRQAAYNSVY